MQQPQERVILMPEIRHQYLSDLQKGARCCSDKSLPPESSMGMPNDSSRNQSSAAFDFPGLSEKAVCLGQTLLFP